MRAPVAAAAALLALAGCAARPARPPATAAATATATGLPFIEDDFTRAVALARERKVPLFVDAWAPW
jgi:hypothetical protein